MNSLIVAVAIIGLVVTTEPGEIISEESIPEIQQMCVLYEVPEMTITRNADGDAIKVVCEPKEAKEPDEILS